LKLQPKQGLAFQTEATEVLYGGAAGGGKSYLLRASAIRWCVEVPGAQVYMFRRTLPDLRDNHLRGPTSFHAMLEPFLVNGAVKYRAVENEFEFWNGSVLHLCYCDSENDVEKYRGAEIHVLIMDELTHFSEYQYRFLRSRVRIAGLKVPPGYASRMPRIEAGSNPGSIGHAWVKRTFITPKPPMVIWRAEAEEGGMLRQFIPARLADNPYLTKDDPSYADRLRGLGADSLVRAMLEGDWDIVAGQAFEKLRRDIHCIEPFEPPADWMCFGSLDWGSTRPFSFGMWAVSNGNALPDGRTYRRGAIIRFNELYGWNGKSNEGIRKEASDVAQMIRSRIGNRKLGYIAADPSMWKVDGGPSIAETMLRYGVILRKADNSRLTGYIQVRQRINGDEDGPMLYATKNCHDGFWRTMPDLVMDERKVEDVDTDQEDHCFAVGTRHFYGVVGEDGQVLNQNGVVSCFKTKRRHADVVKLSFDDGSEVVCTPDHLFRTGRGWVEAQDLLDEVCYNVLSERRAEWFRSLARRFKSFLANAITFAASISNARAYDCTALSGNITTAPSRMDCTSITEMGTEATTRSAISNLFQRPRTFLTTQRETITPKVSRLPEKLLGAGMVPIKEGLGTLYALKQTGLRCAKTQWRKLVRFVVLGTRWLGLSRLSLSIAVMCAVKSRCVAVEQNGKADVICLNVPEGSAFALENGSLVHNCYDDTRYACMSRPWMATVKKPEKKAERWMRFENDSANEESWRTA